MPPLKPRHRSGYSHEETEKVESTLLSVMVTLGAYRDDLRIVGGLVPSLLFDRDPEPGVEEFDLHPGSGDVDLGLDVGLLDGKRYAEVSERLRQEGLEPAKNDNGNIKSQCWIHPDNGIEIDFLLPLMDENDRSGRIMHLEGDFAALVAAGLEIARDDWENVEVEGRTLAGETVEKLVPVCGAAAFVVLKAFALEDRGEPKDAFDLVYTIEREGATAIAARLGELGEAHGDRIRASLDSMAGNFASVEGIGPSRAAAFNARPGGDLDADAADALGYVDDLLNACRKRGLVG